MNEIAFLLTLFFCHWLGDFTHFSTTEMLAAKRYGKPLLPILMHAIFHALLMTIGFLMFRISQNYWLFATIMLITHFSIDVLKGRMNVWFPSVIDTTKYRHWYLFGFDQFLHTIVIVIIWHLSTSNF